MFKAFAVSAVTLFLSKAAIAAPAVQFAAGQTGAVEFSAPGGKMGCVFIKAGGTSVYKSKDGGAELSCDRTTPKYTRVTLGAKGAATVQSNVGDQGCCGVTNILQYGQTWHGGPFTCRSERSGLTCSRSDGRGFTIGKRTISVR